MDIVPFLTKLQCKGAFKPIVDFSERPVVVLDLTSAPPAPTPKGTFDIGKVRVCHFYSYGFILRVAYHNLTKEHIIVYLDLLSLFDAQYNERRTGMYDTDHFDDLENVQLCIFCGHKGLCMPMPT